MRYLVVSKKKNPLFVWGWDRKIRPSWSPFVITQHASWCQSVILGTDFSIPPLHSWNDGFRVRMLTCYPFICRERRRRAKLGVALSSLFTLFVPFTLYHHIKQKTTSKFMLKQHYFHILMSETLVLIAWAKKTTFWIRLSGLIWV